MEIKNNHNFAPIEGKYVNLREVQIEDAAFILKLRTEGKGVCFLHKTDPDINKQIQYLKRYKTLDNEWYFIVEDKKTHKPLGCISAYEIDENSARTGRWVMSPESTIQQSLESDLLIKLFVYYTLEKDYVKSDTRHSNRNILNFFKLWNYEVVSSDDELVYTVLSKETFEKQRKAMERFCK